MIKLNKKIKPIEKIRRGLNFIYSSGIVEMTSMEVVIHAEESLWLRGDKVVYFPVDREMGESLIKGTYSVQNENAFYQGVETFILNLPEGMAFNGCARGSGLLVSIMPHDERTETIYNEFMDWIDRPHIDVTTDAKAGSFTITITYQDHNNPDLYMRMAIPSENAVKVLHMDSAKAYSQYMRETNTFNAYKTKIDLDDEELAYQFEMMKFVCGFMVYKKALPRRISVGLPAIHSKQTSTPATKKIKSLVINHPQKERGTQTGGYRSWHFRQLMDERFYRGEHKNKKRGSRVIFVSDSYVISEVQAKTVRGVL